MIVGGRELLDGLVKVLMERWTVVAPREVEGNVVLAPLEDAGEIVLERPLNSPKEYLLPQEEILFEYRDGGFKAPEPRGYAILGIRPCEFRALLMLKSVMGEDPLFLSRWNSSFFAVQACTEPCPSGFCGDLGGPEFSGIDPYRPLGAPTCSTTPSTGGCSSTPSPRGGRRFWAPSGTSGRAPRRKS